jgi:Uma2 family endonuclease
METHSTTTPAMPPAPAWIPSPLYRMTVEQYEAMAASGAIPSSHRVHLINGYLVQKMTQKPPHVTSASLCRDELDRIKPAGWYVRSAQPIRIPGQASEPEPDHCVLRGTARDYEDHHPGPGDIAMVIEVADSSLVEDRKLATGVYGPAGIPVYWIVDVIHRQVEVYTNPGPQGYGASTVFTDGQFVPVVIDGQDVGRIAVEDILPSR